MIDTLAEVKRLCTKVASMENDWEKYNSIDYDRDWILVREVDDFMLWYLPGMHYMTCESGICTLWKVVDHNIKVTSEADQILKELCELKIIKNKQPKLYNQRKPAVWAKAFKYLNLKT